MQKADRFLNGTDEQNQLLDSYIKTKGIQYVLDAIREKETRRFIVDEDEIADKTANRIIQVLLKELPNRLQVSAPVNTVNTKTMPKNRPDVERLKGLL
ncbi:hypothetical protein skT53_12690 [Effusibacillus dendaii]|uniref:Uncharacterized protein n=2 Tax=Effusibacillus dendaii TaxID=2743772 RepID=A0A7I8D843_9BACL|nr:hypothetical protein skT53_12690 [Effusibacillus dendaii]